MATRLIESHRRGELPQEHVVAATNAAGQPDEDRAMSMAEASAAVAFMLGYDATIVARVVDGQRIPGSYVIRITQPER